MTYHDDDATPPMDDAAAELEDLAARTREYQDFAAEQEHVDVSAKRRRGPSPRIMAVRVIEPDTGRSTTKPYPYPRWVPNAKNVAELQAYYGAKGYVGLYTGVRNGRVLHCRTDKEAPKLRRFGRGYMAPFYQLGFVLDLATGTLYDYRECHPTRPYTLTITRATITPEKLRIIGRELNRMGYRIVAGAVNKIEATYVVTAHPGLST